MTAPARLALFALLALALGAGGYAYWRHGRLHPATDDAYVEANVVRVAALVSGPVTRVLVTDQQTVRAGQLLFEVDRRPFELALAQTVARLAVAGQGVDSDGASVSAARADVVKRQVQRERARANARRVADLRRQSFVSSQAADEAAAAAGEAEAELELAQARLRQTRLALGKTGDQNQRLRDAELNRQQAELDLAHTRVSAACDGQVVEMSLQPGSTARAGAPLFALVCTDKFWIAANFKETQLEHIRPGHPADIQVDMYPDQHFIGRVETISRASGAAFSLLPPQNATGNWVKVTQRVPVRVAVTVLDPSFPLRVGTSAAVTIDTTAESRAVAATR